MDFAEAMQECMHSHGFAVEIMPDGGIAGAIPEGQDQAYRDAHAQCLEQTGYATPPVLFSPDEIGELYAGYVDGAACLRGLGYQVSDDPGRQHFIDTFYSATGWDPWGEVAHTITQSEYYDVLDECPTPF